MSKNEPNIPSEIEEVNEVSETNKTGELSKEYVFTNRNTGEKYSRQQPCIDKMLPRLCAKAEVKAFTFHAIRHYFASSLMRAGGADMMDIQALLGHQRTTTTDTYLRSMSPQLGHLADIIEKAVKE